MLKLKHLGRALRYEQRMEELAQRLDADARKERRTMNRFPSLTAAAKEIAYDNGMVNRYHPEKGVVKDMLDAAKRRYSLTELDRAEAEMRSHIEAGKLHDVCCGGSDRQTEISPLLDEMLDEMFEPA